MSRFLDTELTNFLTLTAKDVLKSTLTFFLQKKINHSNKTIQANVLSLKTGKTLTMMLNLKRNSKDSHSKLFYLNRRETAAMFAISVGVKVLPQKNF